MGMPQQSPGSSFRQLRDFLTQDFDVVDADLGDGTVPEEAELLMIVDPQGFDERPTTEGEPPKCPHCGRPLPPS